MKQRYRMFKRRWGVYYIEDTVTGKQESMDTCNKAEALRILHSKNEAEHLPAFSLKIARVYLQAADPLMKSRTWRYVMDEIAKTKAGETKTRWQRAAADRAFDTIRNLLVVETRAEHFLHVLHIGTVSSNVYLRRIQNFALGMNWLGWPVIPKRQWPRIVYKTKRAITADEHHRIIQREQNAERRAFYELCWHLGGSQTDIAKVRAEDIDWNDHTICYDRQKLKTHEARIKPPLIH